MKLWQQLIDLINELKAASQPAPKPVAKWAVLPLPTKGK